MPSQIKIIKNDNYKDYTIGVISDTHGLLRPEVTEMFVDVDLILHAGDVGDPEIISDLNAVAPLIVVRGNMDYGSWAERLPVVQSIQVGDHMILLIHDVGWIDRDIDLKNYQAVINGHTHRPLIKKQDQLLYFNPGSAGHRRRQYPISVGKLTVRNGQLVPNLIEIKSCTTIL
jgi:putative phosphoesterase